MKIIRLSLRNPIAVIVVILALIYFSFLAIRKIKVDIFPQITSPAIYIAMPYGGLSPAYMDGFMANEFQKVLVFVSGVQDMEFKSVQGLTLMKLSFYPGTDMAQAAAEVSTQVSRAMAFTPPGAVPPQVVRFDAGAQPVGQLVFESPKRSIGELQNLVLSRIRPMFVNIPGISAPAPFGGNTRTMVVNVIPEQMHAYGLTAEEVMLAINRNNFPSPAGNVQIDNQDYMVPVNTLELGPEDFLNTPVKTGNGPTVFIRDIATVTDGTDKITGYALVNGKRTVYLPIIKKADASTLDAINNLKNSMDLLKDTLPEDVSVEYVFDQSGYIENALSNLMHEGILGALLTGLMVLLFLGDKRGALIVVLTIPIAILSAIITLYLFDQTINIMTLSGLALAIGVLVDEATVTIENIHQHFETNKPKSRAVLDALLEISVPKLLILLCILAVLIPSFMMAGVPRDMFMPLSIAVGAAMVASFLASQTFIPVLANWIMKNNHTAREQKKQPGRFEKFRNTYLHTILGGKKRKPQIVGGYLLIVILLVGLCFSWIGTDILPASDARDLQLRIQAPQGSTLEKTEEYILNIEDLIKEETGEGGIKITSAFVGMHSPNSPINPIFLFTTGSHEAVLQFSVNGEAYNGSMEALKERIRNKVAGKFPEIQLTFEPMELVEKIMSQGNTTPIAIKILGKDLSQAKTYALKLQDRLKDIDYMRDVHITEPLNYPSISVQVDRERVAQFGLSMKQVNAALTTATSSSRYINKNVWIDPNSGLVYQVQVQLPETRIKALNDLRKLPLKPGSLHPILEDVADLTPSEEQGQVNRQGPNRFITLLANTHDKDLGSAAVAVKKAIRDIGPPPRGYLVKMTGATEILGSTLSGLQEGLFIAIIVIFLLLSAYYQSFQVSAVILSMVPAVIGGSLLFLLFSGSTLNLQSYMGMIMAVGVSVSNAVLIVNQAEVYRTTQRIPAFKAALGAVESRFRPILMTASAMIAGMIPMALGIGDGGGQVAPLGQAVIGGLLFSTLASLLVLPYIYTLIRSKATFDSVSLDPDDPSSKYFTPQSETKIES
ncbi:efflux RND transporter permease subunit [Sinomicrobium weinanense]|uniref:Efflux RND transporter permease subunit n=1 Tax=Sinomicrobium weinanense TaxID=2842200 RepID=A0A926JP98_9FLAO|nr:efflux RND transporter permease subunit [Sinomicrobium weinanense]MBC9794972.1 efflux RND transporter permease subunit [Sinomicrobium weinanense]MBU3125167.1 efflux RND transporter permease subunit [Sinomicrobium weinanense]